MTNLVKRAPSSGRLFLAMMSIAILAPKLSFFDAGVYSGAGVRFEDICALFIFIALIITADRSAVYVLTKNEIFLLFVFVGAISISLNAIFDRGNLLYVLRLCEYFIFALAARRVASSDAILTAVYIIIYINSFLVFLQYLDIVGGLKDGVYYSTIGKPSGLTNGSYEVALLLVIALGGLLLLESRRNHINLTTLVVFTSVFMTASRIPLVALVIIFLMYHFSFRLRSLFKFLGLGTVLLLALIVLLKFQNGDQEGALSRLSNVVSEETFSNVGRAWSIRDGLPNGVTGNEYRDNQILLTTSNVKGEIASANIDGDLSLMIRLGKWSLAFKTFINQSVPFIAFGIAPGTVGNALDGGWLRVLVEFGLFGLVVFLWWLKQLSRVKFCSRSIVIVLTPFVLGNVFIDYFLSSKVMFFFMMLVGFFTYNHLRRAAR